MKPIGPAYTNKTVNFHTGEVTEVTIEPATEEEVKNTVEVMGGDDWELWMNELAEGGVLAPDVTTIAFSYIGSEITKAIYRDGSIGQAKDHLEATALKLNEKLATGGGRAYVTVSKALVTQSSSAIPVVPLYVSALYKVMKEKGCTRAASSRFTVCSPIVSITGKKRRWTRRAASVSTIGSFARTCRPK